MHSPVIEIRILWIRKVRTLFYRFSGTEEQTAGRYEKKKKNGDFKPEAIQAGLMR